MQKNLRDLTRVGWVTKPPGRTPENRLTAAEVDANFLLLEDAINAIAANHASADQTAVSSSPSTAQLAVLVNALRSALIASGIIKGSA